MISLPWGVVTLTEDCIRARPRDQRVERACYDGMVERIREGGAARIYAYVHCAVTDRDRFAEAARRDLFAYAVADGYARQFARAGFADDVATMQERWAARDRSDKEALAARNIVSQSALDQARAALRAAEARLAFTQIRAPADGVLITRAVEPGAASAVMSARCRPPPSQPRQPREECPDRHRRPRGAAHGHVFRTHSVP